MKKGNRDIIIYGLIGFAFLFFQIVGYDLAAQSAAQTTQTTGISIGNIEWTPGYVLRTGMLSLCGGALFGVLGRLIGRLAAKQRERGNAAKVAEAAEAGTPAEAAGGRKRWVWPVSLGLLLLCWLPCYLAYYPGICAYDATIQTGQIVSGSYNDHHPIAHTLLIAGAMRLGESGFGDSNTGIAMLVFLQMVLLAVAFAGGVTLLYRRGVSGKWLIGLQAFGMFYPFHMYMSVSLIKDVWFSLFFLVQMLALCEMIRRKRTKPDGYDVLFFVASIGMQLFRNNGRYAMLVLAAVLFAAVIFGKTDRKLWMKMLGNCALALVVGSLCLTGLFRVTGAEQGDRREMLSMPIQQLARCMLFHGGVGELEQDDGTMDEASKALINDFLLDEGYRFYRPEISDPVKNHTNTYVVRYRSAEFVRTYLRLLGMYPGDLVNAAYAVNAGYFYLDDVTHAVVNQNGRDRGLGYVQTRWVEDELNPRGIYKDSKWEWLHEKLEQWADENAYLKLPLLRYLFVPGIFGWLYLLLAGHLAVGRRYDGFVPLSLVFGYYLTLFLGPVVQLRYLYPLMLVLPFVAVFTLGVKRNNELADE